MRGLGRRVLYLVEKDFQKARADWGGLIESPFDWADPAPGIDAAVKAFLAPAPRAPRGGAATRPVPAPHSCAALLKVSTTGRRSTSRSPHHPAASASRAPATPPTSGTRGEGFQLNSNT